MDRPDRATPASAPGTALHTLIVAELDAFLAAARGRGVEPGADRARSGEGMRQSIVTDPDGNRLKVAAPVAES